MKIFLDSLVGDNLPTNLAECSLPRTVFYRSADLRIILKMGDVDNLVESSTGSQNTDERELCDDAAKTRDIVNDENDYASWRNLSKNLQQPNEIDINQSPSVKKIVDGYEKLSAEIENVESQSKFYPGQGLHFTESQCVQVSLLFEIIKETCGMIEEIDPGESLEFMAMQDNHDPLDTLTLTNTSEKNVAFKLKCTSPDRYDVHPSSNIIPPGESAEVLIYLSHESSSGVKKDKFLILYMEVDSFVKPSSINYLFKTTNAKNYLQHRLRCKLVQNRAAPLVVKSSDITIPKGQTQLSSVVDDQFKEQLYSTMDGLISHQERMDLRVTLVQKNVIFLTVMFIILCLAVFISYWQESLPVNKYTINACVPHYL